MLRRLTWRLEAALLGLLLRLSRALGPVRASDLGGWIGRSLGPALPVSRVADANLRLALPELDGAARRRVVRGVWDGLGRTVAELPHLPALGRTAAGPGWEIAGEEILQELLARGGPVVMFSGHLGNWELLGPAAAAFGIPLGFFYRAPANPHVDRMLARLRRVGEAALFPKGAAGARRAMAHLASGGQIGLLMDQKLNDGIPVEFFGHMAMTAPAAAMLALRFRCPLVPARVQRLGPARHRVVLEPPLPLPASGDLRADIAALTRAINQTLERWIRATPEDWLWLHRRWPRETMPADPRGY